jgi:hypothetical protein
MANEEPEAREQGRDSLELRVAALEDKLAGLTVTDDELETYKKVMKVARLMRWRSAARGLGAPSLASGCISGCISPCDCSDCGCIEGCIDFAASRMRRGAGRTQRRFGNLGR